jgi:hypothetical protein
VRAIELAPRLTCGLRRIRVSPLRAGTPTKGDRRPLFQGTHQRRKAPNADAARTTPSSRSAGREIGTGTVTATDAEALLFVVTGSASAAVTVAEIVAFEAVAGAVRVITIVADAPFASEPALQVTTDVPLHVAWLGIAETKTKPGGSVVVAVTPVALDGPLFVTVTVHAAVAPAGHRRTDWPALAGSYDVFVTELSATGSAFLFSTYLGGKVPVFVNATDTQRHRGRSGRERLFRRDH